MRMQGLQCEPGLPGAALDVGGWQPEPGLVGGQEEPPEGISDIEQAGFRETGWQREERPSAVSPWVGRSAAHGGRADGSGEAMRATKRQPDGVQRGTQKTKPWPSLSSFSVKGPLNALLEEGGEIPTCADTVCVTWCSFHGHQPHPPLRPPAHPPASPKRLDQSKINHTGLFPTQASALCSASFITCLPPA